MKSFLKIFNTIFFVFSISLNAQDNQRWYVDDIYYDSSEKEVIYTEVIEYTNDYDTLNNRDYYFDEDEMSYSMRINRFHRDYYGSSISFHYGVFHDPFWGIGFGYGNYYWDDWWYWSSPYYSSWYYQPYWGHHYNWYSPWYNQNYYGWNNPYYCHNGYYAYGDDYYSSNTYSYGPRNAMNTNLAEQTVNRGPRRVVQNKEAVRRVTLDHTKAVTSLKDQIKRGAAIITYTPQKLHKYTNSGNKAPSIQQTKSYNKTQRTKASSSKSYNSSRSNSRIKSSRPSKSNNSNSRSSQSSRRP